MNSSIEIEDAITILRKLIDRTREGRLRWQTADDGYTTTLEPNLRVRVSSGESDDDDTEIAHFGLVEFDPRIGNAVLGILGGESWVPDKEVLRVSVAMNPSYGYSTVQEKQFADLLMDMIALARRSALNLDSSVKRALTYLDKIAG